MAPDMTPPSMVIHPAKRLRFAISIAVCLDDQATANDKDQGRAGMTLAKQDHASRRVPCIAGLDLFANEHAPSFSSFRVAWRQWIPDELSWPSVRELNARP
jgi:hypothetical protein